MKGYSPSKLRKGRQRTRLEAITAASKIQARKRSLSFPECTSDESLTNNYFAEEREYLEFMKKNFPNN